MAVFRIFAAPNAARNILSLTLFVSFGINYMKNATERLLEWVPQQSADTLIEYFEIDIWDTAISYVEMMAECQRENLVDEIEAGGHEI